MTVYAPPPGLPFFFFQAEDGIRDYKVTGVQTCALPIWGHFKNVHGTLEFDPDAPERSSVEAIIDARGLWTGEPQRDAHLKSVDFLDVEKHRSEERRVGKECRSRWSPYH